MVGAARRGDLAPNEITTRASFLYQPTPHTAFPPPPVTARSPIPASSVSLAAHTPVPVDVTPIPPTPERQQFVDWLCEVVPHIHAFHDKTFVIGFGGESIKANMLSALVNDVALLHAMGMRIMLVRGSCPQVEK